MIDPVEGQQRKENRSARVSNYYIAVITEFNPPCHVRDRSPLTTGGRTGKYVLLSSGSEHHVVPLQEVDDASPAGTSPDSTPGLRGRRGRGISYHRGSRSSRNEMGNSLNQGISRSIYVDTREQRDREEWEGENTSFSLDWPTFRSFPKVYAQTPKVFRFPGNFLIFFVAVN